MKRMTLAAAIIAAVPMTAQNIVPTNQVIDFGQVVFKKPVRAQFELVNQGESNVNIKDVKVSCGCTTVNFPQGYITKNKPFVVEAEYDAKMLGHFEKYIAVYTSDATEPLTLTMKGVVVAEVKDYDGGYHFAMGRLKTDCNEIEFDDVSYGERPVYEIHIQNSSSDMATPTFLHLPPYIKAEMSPSTLPPGKSGIAKLTLDSRLIKDFGLSQTSIYLGQYPGDKISPDKEIVVSTVLLPTFAPMDDEQLQRAAQIQVSTYNLDLGKFDGKKKKKGVIEIENTGKSLLEIYTLQMFTPGISVEMPTTRVRPGDKVKMKVTAERKALQNVTRQPRILMITNDPSNQKVLIKVSVE